MKRINYKILLLFIVFNSCSNKEQKLKLVNIEIEDYYFFNEILLEKNTEFVLNPKSENVKITNKEFTTEYSFFYYKKQKEISIIKEDMVIKFYDIRFKVDTVFLKTTWLPEEFSINWKEEYWNYKRDGIELTLVKVN